ncbi:sensor histidine kinase [Candidatus Electronema sp. JC]|uniref:sensor histidine kinase n=1 Tax=Candidatus Electronema sp. JC TaxID=3401570 RepID=UPI003AA9AD81
MTDFLLRTVVLKKRIALGYIVTGLVAFMIALLSYSAFNRLAADFRQIVLFSRHSADNMAFTRQMSEMQRQALIYIYEGHSSAGAQVGEIYKQMMDSIVRNRELDRIGAEAVVGLARRHLEFYYEAFQEVRRQRQLQERLVKSEFRVHATRAQQLIEDAVRDIGGRDQGSTLISALMLNSLLQIEKNAYRYFDSLDAAFIDSATSSIQSTRTMLSSLSRRPESSSGKTAEIAAVLDRYESTFLEAVQRTRGYLYLVNVVMAAQAYETIYQSNKLSAMMIRETERIQDEAFRHIGSRMRLLLISIGLLLLFIGLFSYLISRSITLPLKRLTETFKLLSSGSADAEIPPCQLQDELGELTGAAASFKKKNIELRASKKELERSNDELEQFVYTVSHDLKSPIVTSMGFIGIIRKLAAQGKAEQAVGMLEKVVKANERMSQLINDLLELSRVGRIDMDKKLINLNALLADFARTQAERLKAAQFTLSIGPEMPSVQANESRTLQVFENILSNALKYVRNENEGGRLEISAEEDGRWHHIYCADNGPGIPAEYREKIFGLFYRLDVNIEGTGIGLAVAKKIMKFHGGDIQAEERSGGGAVFHLTFPKTELDSAALRNPETLHDENG